MKRPQSIRILLKRLTLCLSLANLCLLPAWVELFRFRAEAPEDMGSRAARSLFCATLLNVVLLSLGLAITAIVLRRVNSRVLDRIIDCGFLFLMVSAVDWPCWQIVTGAMRVGIPRPPLYFMWTLAISAPLVGCFVTAVDGNRGFVRGARVFLWLFSPLPILFAGTLLWAIITAPLKPANQMLAPRTEVVPSRRIVWLVFDGWDQRLTFDVKPSNVHLPELDRLLKESVYCTHAVAPAWDTSESILSLITGLRISKVTDATSANAFLDLGDGSTVELRTVPNVFAEARKMGLNTALIGWYLPYCTLLGSSLNACFQPHSADVKSSDIAQIAINQWHDQIAQHWLVALFGNGLFRWDSTVALTIEGREERIEACRLMMDKAAAAVRDPSVGLVFLHWPIPHPPGIWDRQTDDFTQDFASNYLDNLELVDRMIGEILQDVASAGLDDRTTLIISSDHPFRPDIWYGATTWTLEEDRLSGRKRSPYIPFIIHLPNENRAFRFDGPVNTVMSRELVLGLLEENFGQGLSTESDIVRFLGERVASSFANPHNGHQ